MKAISRIKELREKILKQYTIADFDFDIYGCLTRKKKSDFFELSDGYSAECDFVLFGERKYIPPTMDKEGEYEGYVEMYVQKFTMYDNDGEKEFDITTSCGYAYKDGEKVELTFKYSF